VLNQDAHTVVVYRKPDAALDARVRSEVTDVTVELRDARMNLREMQDLMARVLADAPASLSTGGDCCPGARRGPGLGEQLFRVIQVSFRPPSSRITKDQVE
jgi:hypothetical protein